MLVKVQTYYFQGTDFKIRAIIFLKIQNAEYSTDAFILDGLIYRNNAIMEDEEDDENENDIKRR